MTRSSDSGFLSREDFVDFVDVGEDGPGGRSLDGDQDPTGFENTDHLGDQGLPVSDLSSARVAIAIREMTHTGNKEP